MLRGLALGTIVISIFFMLVYKITGALLPSPWKRIYTAYISVSLPDDWDCNLEETAWVCQSEVQKKVAILIFTAKVVGPRDSREVFLKHLSTPKHYEDSEGNKLKSEVLEVKTKKIRNIDWVYGSHIGSEIPFYETRYYATIHKNIAIAFTFSFHIGSRARYEKISEQIAASLYVTL